MTFATSRIRRLGNKKTEGCLVPAALLLTAEAGVVVGTLALTLSLAVGLDAVAVAGDVGGGHLALLVVPNGIVGDGLTFVQGAEALRVDDGLMDENVLGAIGWADEAEALLGVEKLDGSLTGHFVMWRIRFCELRIRGSELLNAG